MQGRFFKGCKSNRKETGSIARQADEGVIGSISIGLLSAPLRNFLPELVQKFRSKYPRINVNLFFYQVGQMVPYEMKGMSLK